PDDVAGQPACRTSPRPHPQDGSAVPLARRWWKYQLQQWGHDVRIDQRADTQPAQDDGAGGIPAQPGAGGRRSLAHDDAAALQPGGGRGPRTGKTPQPARPRRQWGAEKPRPPLPMVEKPAGQAATWLGGLAMVVTVGAWVTYLIRTVVAQVIDY